ncbi:DUF1835 domain-containing protein [Azospirillum sp. RWY-5-1]|uniref:DUF1835 domain-containing protein n=1 Tax=Azospirillum oleiclasticum TaxID=2735135 RepID=A0ABX2T4Y6_9PROT|nr:DUF1835 domain-containing protein [Azospirillum oleiclasticum]NYZ12201.1 DUF1835 domain-containing protein [Azospirillum oleiclasticum]NYZ19361.1 DUF1835 domain-containing protein [Azospirillum oleiclasticum]
MTDPTAGRPRVPFRLDLDQQKTRAKELLKALRAGDPAAAARLGDHHPKRPAPAAAVLADAQLVIARELGVPSWPRLRAHVDAMRAARAAIGGPAPDAETPTLHIRCGSDIHDELRDGGFTGDFLEVSDPICMGPVPEQGDLIATRARFLADSFGATAGQDMAAMTARLTGERDGLANAAGRYRRVVLWMEHDSYDQLILARCLAAFAEGRVPAVLELVSADHFPGSERFIGLGQLPPEALRLLWGRRRRLGAGELAGGRAVWAALRRDDPRGLADLAATGVPGLPHMAGALGRHLAELPGVADGLSLTERLTLALLMDGEERAGRLYARLMREREPLPWLGDLMYWTILEALGGGREPLYRIAEQAPESEPSWRHRLAITDAGRAVLAGRLDRMALDPPERWVGGVRIAPGGPVWRWDGEAGRPVLR